jgi:hypothetical protein
MQASRSTSDEVEFSPAENSPPKHEEILREFQMIQGGFKAILDMLLKASDDVQVDLMNTLKKVLISNSRNKLEFKKVNGYTNF